ncbi:hypothetical protein OROMI_008932 [Orobanche minor]
MVGFSQNPGIEGVKAEVAEDIIRNQSLPDSNKANELFIPELVEFPSSFSESFLDFDSLNGWYMEGGGANMADLGENPVDFETLKGELIDIKKEIEVFGDLICGKDETVESLNVKAESLWGSEMEDGEIGIIERCVEEDSERMNVEGAVSGDGGETKLEDLGCSIEGQLGKVSLDGAAQSSVPIVASVKCENGGREVSADDSSQSVKMAVASCDGMKSDDGGGNGVEVSGNANKADEGGSGDESEDKSTSDSSSSSSSASSSSSEEDDDEEKSGEKKGKNKDGSADEETEVEDGEIMLSEIEEMVGWSDAEDEEGGGGGGPIKSKNELKDLPPVPSVTVTLEPHHQTLPVGTILSMIGCQVIIEGVEKHNPLNEGSILWITESRSPLGIIDEIFGPVKNPYYIVRYNSEDEVPTGIQQGASISFVAEFADHVLNDKSLYQKGYDASNENDEELSDDAEFSDDEKEAEYRRMMKMKKRGTNDSKTANKRKDKRQQKNQKSNWNNNRDPAAQVGTSLNQESQLGPSGPRPSFVGDQVPIPQFPHRPQAPTFSAPNGSWSNGIPQNQQQNTNFLSGLPPNGMLWMQQSLPYLYPTPLLNGGAFQQQMGMINGMPPNFNANFGGLIPSWPMNPNGLIPPQFGMQAPLPMNVGVEQGVQSQGSQDSRGMQQPPPAFGFNGGGRGGGGGEQGVQSHGSQDSRSSQPPPPAFGFNVGGRGGGGRGGGRGQHRGRGRFGGGRGRRS